ncbi:MAG: hypothetical protein FWE05_11625 [Defluviitaleaceae bacterium]|nr:hypothetical protein [Defluviitaleaceae bacterium]
MVSVMYDKMQRIKSEEAKQFVNTWRCIAVDKISNIKYKDLFLTIFNIVEAMEVRTIEQTPTEVINSIQIKTMYPKTKIFLTEMLNLILLGYSDELFEFFSELNFTKIASTISISEEIEEIVLAKYLVKYFRVGNKNEIYQLMNIVGGSELCNQTIPSYKKWMSSSF